MMVQTTHGADKIELYGEKGETYIIQIASIDAFVGELEKMTDKTVVYNLGTDESPWELPGNKVEKTIKYLQQARTIGVKLAKYTQIY